jgi:hypothetical protein
MTELHRGHLHHGHHHTVTDRSVILASQDGGRTWKLFRS